MRSLKVLSISLAAVGLMCFTGFNSLVMADQNDIPHKVHMDSLLYPRGPSITDCADCHTATPETYENASQDKCYTCHSSGGVYDGVNNSTIGAVNNWENTGTVAGATQSLVYNIPGDGALKTAKDRWCAGCHDQDPAGVLLDNFEGYTDDDSLRAEWLARQDARKPFLMSNDGPDGSQSMRVSVVWDLKLNRTAGFVKRYFDPYIDLRGADALRFYMKVSNKRRIKNISIKLIKEEGGAARARVLKRNLKNNQWQRITLRRSDFNDTTWGKVTGIQIFIREKDPAQDLKVQVSVDDIRAVKLDGNWGTNVIGDNVTYGFYVTGHGTLVKCSFCHDTASDHIDDEQRPVFEYIKDRQNPTGFRLYSDPAKGMQLPYTFYDPGSEGAFALCYQCHDEQCITQDTPAENLNTNFTDTGWVATGPDNLHLLHVGGPAAGSLTPEVFHGTCVLCHDVMAPRKPAMTRREMGNLIYFDNNGCEVTDRTDWLDADINKGGAQTEGIFTYFPTLCMVCHLEPAPPNPDCAGSNPYVTSLGMDGWYKRDFGETCVLAVGASHSAHLTDPKGPKLGEDGCYICHDSTNFSLFTDGEPLASTGTCDDCHSTGGDFGGATLAKSYWENGVYEDDRVTLQSGKEQWCSSCHDNVPANSNHDGSGVNAPNITGDNATYGFYVTGHNINCLECHDAAKNHIDGNSRTYEVTEGSPPVVVNVYGDSYRLRDINGQSALNLPMLTAFSPGDFALCLDCHNASEVLGADVSDVTGTNFWNDDLNDQNSHRLHLTMTAIHFDSDWDGLADSRESCIACHNVHGAPNQAMVRHGELISTPGTTDKVPALNFSYLVPPSGPTATATWTFNVALNSTYNVYAWWVADANRASDAPYTIHYNGGSQTIRVSQEINGGGWNLLGTFPFVTTDSGSVVLGNDADEFVGADAIKVEEISLAVPDIIMDEEQASYVSSWSLSANPQGYNGDSRYHAKALGTLDLNATLGQSVGGHMAIASSNISGNGVCNACHGAISYVRAANLMPRVINPKADPDTVPNDGSGATLITAFVYDPDGDLSTVEVDLSAIGGTATQQMYDNGTNGDVTPGDGVYSYWATIPNTTSDVPKSLVITATDVAANMSQNSAALLVIKPGSIYVDNSDATFVCTWTCISSSGIYGDDYCYKAAGLGSCTATWTPNIPQANNYRVYAWWKAWANRATDAPYTIYYDGGSATIQVNQEFNGSQWNLLGTFPFVPGTSGTVVLTDDANEYVIADAIKFEPQP